MAQPDFVENFRKDGYAVIPNFLSEKEIITLKNSIGKIVDDMDPKEHAGHLFRTIFDENDPSHISRDGYFMSSGDKIRFFFEPDAVDEKTGELLVPKSQSVNKIGHALAWLDPAFKNVTFSNKMKDVCRRLGHKDPRVVQSMYIFKNPGIGQKVDTHQDSTFLYVDPPSHLLGLWIALDDAELENGCLHFIPGSQTIKPTLRFVRNPDVSDAKLTRTLGVQPEYPMDHFKAVPVKKGSLVLIHGNVVHRSEKNTSEKPRHAYTFHVVDFDGATYSEKNWLQETEQLPFPKLYETEV